MVKDYLSLHQRDPEDAVMSGVKGMKWGVRNPRSVLRARAAKKATASAPSKAPEAHAAKPAASEHHQSFGAASGESSSDRYSRLASQAKSGKASDMTEQDLKFFNARTDALAKINKMNEAQPNWLKDTAVKVMKQTAENQLQTIANGVANKYVSGPLLAGLSTGAAVAKQAKADAKPSSTEDVLKTPMSEIHAAKSVGDTGARSSIVAPPRGISKIMKQDSRLVTQEQFNARMEAAQRKKNERLAGLFGPVEK
jgi:hypothetical protein